MKTLTMNRRSFFATAILGTALGLFPTLASAGEDRLPEEEFTFAQICDTQFGMGGYEEDMARFASAVELVNASDADFVVICGDLVHRANEKSFADFKRIQSGFQIPCHLAPGNHDVGGSPTAETLKLYRDTFGKDYYSFSHKGYTFLIVNTQLWREPVAGESEQHDQWFEATLSSAAERGSPVFVVGHIPLYVKDLTEKHTYHNLPLSKRADLLETMHQHGVVAFLAGHTHRTLIREHDGIQMVNGETTSKNFDKRPFGFRLWHVSPPRPFRHEFVPLDQNGENSQTGD